MYRIAYLLGGENSTKSTNGQIGPQNFLPILALPVVNRLFSFYSFRLIEPPFVNQARRVKFYVLGTNHAPLFLDKGRIVGYFDLDQLYLSSKKKFATPFRSGFSSGEGNQVNQHKSHL